MSGPACRAVHTTIWTPECTHPAGHEGAHSWATGHGQGREDRWRSPAAWRALLDAAEARAAKAEKERDDRRFAAWCPRCESWQAPELVGLDGRCHVHLVPTEPPEKIRRERDALRADCARISEELDISGEADAVRRAESAELGCEIAYRREPTQAEGDVHEYRHEQSMGASEAIRECHVPMGNHHGHRCLCGRWVWGGPTVCQRCVDAEAVKAALLRADTDARVKAEWEKLFNERNRLWREEADRVDAVTLLLEANGCDCDCDHDAESHDADCDRCLACRISWAIET